jgi:hypothetical protein
MTSGVFICHKCCDVKGNILYIYIYIVMLRLVAKYKIFVYFASYIYIYIYSEAIITYIIFIMSLNSQSNPVMVAVKPKHFSRGTY